MADALICHRGHGGHREIMTAQSYNILTTRELGVIQSRGSLFPLWLNGGSGANELARNGMSHV